jgi:predicted Zn finger-like uncharacterized protein
MSGRGQALTRTRCPACGTVFRVTSEQLRLKAGKVRCGHCQTVFNAFDHLQMEELRPSDASLPVPEPDFTEAALPETPQPDGTAEMLAAFTADTPASAPESKTSPVVPEMPEAYDEQVFEDVQAAGQDRLEPLPEPLPESPEQTTQAAREAGLVAVRELADSNAAYNRWSAGALAGDGFGGFDEPAQKSPVWPYVLVFLLLLMVLVGQLSWHFRTEIVLRMPASAEAYAALGVDVPLPREAALVSIETSDLQADAARGLFVLNATLKNRAAYAQAWPSLELTLTDINDRVVARRVIESADYLQPGAPKEHFPANAETGVRLWIEASDIGATGYRLYIFYP